ncbi:hypothetical protein GUJ93_ZPchr0006g45898 [Zizania palustris]|uniref:Uncharacterized protein n=1 Tax=Zizania palustris TaxID=103762 RepID=A0A8J5SDW4_ZIZPA|nr:hypothetical protein GUJ93_ZPchr0006g45898 [Zizania palustris]
MASANAKKRVQKLGSKESTAMSAVSSFRVLPRLHKAEAFGPVASKGDTYALVSCSLIGRGWRVAASACDPVDSSPNPP